MELGRVRGSVWCTRKSGRMAGYKLLLVEPWDPLGQRAAPKLKVCADVIGAGVGERVVLAGGAAARRAIGDETAPIDAAVVAIVDGYET